MKKMMLWVSFTLCIVTACNKQTTTGTYYDYEIECLGTDLDGSETLRVWGKGRNKTTALEQAKKNAVYAVLFKGINSNGECNIKPLITEVNAQEKYRYYFNTFLKDGGDFLKYISMKDRRYNTTVVEKRAEQRKYGVTVRVLRAELEQRLIADGIIKP